MLSVEDAHKLLGEKLTFDAGKFFGPAGSLSIGVGQIYLGIRYPLYSPEREFYQTAEGAVYLLTHECDIDQRNVRPFNADLLICPILDFRIFVDEYQRDFSEALLKSFISALGLRDVSRVIYLPYYDDSLPYGGLLYLNQISNTNIASFSKASAQRLCSVTRYGLQIIDQSICHHLLRPKAEVVPLMDA
jgi:hypothetical protein